MAQKVDKKAQYRIACAVTGAALGIASVFVFGIAPRESTKAYWNNPRNPLEAFARGEPLGYTYNVDRGYGPRALFVTLIGAAVGGFVGFRAGESIANQIYK
jgi:hypothetical protein